MCTLRRGNGFRVILIRAARALSFLLFLPVAMPAWSHEEIEIQIAELTRQMAREPENATLLLRRGELHRFHRDWPAALADFRGAIDLDPGLHVVNLCVGRMLLEADMPALALVALDRFLLTRPDHAEAHLTRARAFLKLGMRLAAAIELTRGIDLKQDPHRGSKGPQPDDYLDRAWALASEGGEHVDEAIHGLDEGARKLGGAITLQLLAIDIEASRERWDAALERLSAVEARSPRKERWLARRGEVLLEAGRLLEARRAFEAASEAIEALPDHCRSTQATSALAARVRNALSTPCLAENAGLTGNAQPSSTERNR